MILGLIGLYVFPTKGTISFDNIRLSKPKFRRLVTYAKKDHSIKDANTKYC